MAARAVPVRDRAPPPHAISTRSAPNGRRRRPTLRWRRSSTSDCGSRATAPTGVPRGTDPDPAPGGRRRSRGAARPAQGAAGPGPDPTTIGEFQHPRAAGPRDHARGVGVRSARRAAVTGLPWSGRAGRADRPMPRATSSAPHHTHWAMGTTKTSPRPPRRRWTRCAGRPGGPGGGSSGGRPPRPGRRRPPRGPPGGGWRGGVVVALDGRGWPGPPGRRRERARGRPRRGGG